MKSKITQILKLFTASLALGATALSAASFNFKDPKGVNNVSFTMDAPLEYISGTANGISGMVAFDPEHPEKTTGEIVLDTSTLMVANNMMRNHMLGENWMDVENHPTITFEAKEMKFLEETDNGYEATAVGHLTVKGVTKEIEIPVQLTYLPGKLGARSNGQMEGDLLVLRSTFSIHRDEFNINAGNSEDKVSNEIELKLSLAGYHEA